MPSFPRRSQLLRYLLPIMLIVAIVCLLATRSTGEQPRRQPQSHDSTVTPDKTPPKPPAAELPGGGYAILPDKRIVALYGTPNLPVLGVLGEQPVGAAISRAKALAADYQKHSDKPIMPAFEIIATVASAAPTEDGDYSREIEVDTLRPWIDEARKAGVYVILDLQPGRSDFLSQAKTYEPLLREPNVGLALDPEWRLKPDQVHLEQIGSVAIDEVNHVSGWLADLTHKNNLPQKVFLLHQFRLSMLTDRSRLNTKHPELATIIQMDGQGAQNIKRDSWRVITANPPEGVVFGWKNFIDEDKPTLTPAETMTLSPVPWYISYQ